MRYGLICGVLGLLATGGCQEKMLKSPEDLSQKPVMKAFFAEDGVVIDGQLDDAVWDKAPVYNLQLADDASGNLEEAGQAKIAWDHEYFYLGVKFKDSSVKAEGTEDHEHHYKFGDVCELFLRPANRCHYWEMYVTPKGHKTVFFFKMRGSEIQVDKDFDLVVAADVKGTLNRPDDRDQYWTGEMKVPVKDLTRYGDDFGPGSKWRVLVARYNYSPYLDKNPELSMTPKLSVTSYHRLEEYAVIKFVE